MYGIEMIYTVKTLSEKGFSQRAIARELSISRRTVKKYLDQIHSKGVVVPKQERSKKLDPYRSEIIDWLSMGLTGVLIHEKICKDKALLVSYASVSRYLSQFKTPEVYIPLLAKSGQEAQVDFGYLGRFIKDGKSVKVWCFSMVLSHSRYSYHCLVTNQSVENFINCHKKAFEFFGAVPHTVKIDNLKAGVITPNFYEPTIQVQYAEFLEHYKAAPITARIRRGQDKGKVEAGVKYVKSNFLKRINHNDFYSLEQELFDWTTNICNKRLHGTTKKIPEVVFNTIERVKMHDLPYRAYELYRIEHRKVNTYAHISFKTNFYSVPYTYIGKTLLIKYTNTLLKIYDNTTEIALHKIHKGQGEFISVNEHAPPEKQKKTEDYYKEKASEFGLHTLVFLKTIKNQKPHQWMQIIKGVFALEKHYDKNNINLACKRALDFKVHKYISIKNICKNQLYNKSKEDLNVPHQTKNPEYNLKLYDHLTPHINLTK